MNIQNTNSNFIIENKFRILFFILLFILSSLRIFGQTTPSSITIQKNEEVIIISSQLNLSYASANTQIDFVSWFMGSRQSQINEIESENTSNLISTKKQILNSGITPNKVLYRTFMKRVISKDISIA